LLPNGCSCSQLRVTPANWQTHRATLRPWYITYRFYDPVMGVKQRFIKGMNEYHTLADRQEATRALLENELHILKDRGYNPFTGYLEQPEVQTYEIDPSTPVVPALQAALGKVTAAASTIADLKSVLRGVEQAVEQLRYSRFAISEIRRRHVLAILDRCAANIPRWSAHRYNQYRTYLSILFRKLVHYEAIEFNPCQDIEKQKVVKRIRETLNFPERKAVDAHLCKNFPLFWRYVHIFFHSGARGTELLALRREDVDMVNLRFKSVIKKGRQYVEKWRPIKLIAAPLWEEVLREAAPGQYLFSKGLRPGSVQIRSDQVGKRWKRHVKDKLGITASFYSLKHLNVTEMVELMGERAAMIQTGHTTPTMIRTIYDTRHAQREEDAVRAAGNQFA
jgi:integrase